MDVAGTDVAGTDVAGMAVYLDSCIVIYLVEEHPICAAPIQQTLAAAGNVRLCISPLVELECLVGAYKLADSVLQAEYMHFFEQLVRLEIPAPAYDRAARLRASHGITYTGRPARRHSPTSWLHTFVDQTMTGCSKAFGTFAVNVLTGVDGQ